MRTQYYKKEQRHFILFYLKKSLEICMRTILWDMWFIDHDDIALR